MRLDILSNFQPNHKQDLKRVLNIIEKDAEVQREGDKSWFEIRKDWSKYIIWLVTGILITEFILILGIGLQWFDFKEYRTFLYIFLGQYFFEIIGWGVIVVRHLFPSNKE